MYNVGYLVGSLTSWAMVAFLLYRLHAVRWRDRGRWALAGAVFFSAVGQLVEVAAVAGRLDALTHVPNVYRLIAYLCANFIGVCEAVLVFHWAPGGRAGRRLRARLVFAVACTVGYLATFVAGNDPGNRFTVEHVRSPAVALFLLIYVAVQISYLGDVMVVAWRFSQVTPRPWMRAGLRIAATGGAIGVLEALVKASYVVVGLAGGHPHGEEAVGSTIVMVASVFLLVGWSTPALEPLLESVRTWLVRYQAQWRLYPLWLALYTAIPSIGLEPPTNRWAATWSPRDVRLRTLRRLIEIRDGRLTLAPSAHPDVADIAHRRGREAGLSGTALDAVVEAAVIASALQALRRGGTASVTTEVPEIKGFNELGAEIAWLCAVAQAFTGSSVVTAANDACGTLSPHIHEGAR